MRLLIVEDEILLSRQLAKSLAESGYAVDCAAEGEHADFLARTESYDAIVLDLGLPKIDGLTLLRHWREAGILAPVLILTARGSWHEKVQGIDGGADDYVSKPFRMEEVLARLRALIRRATGIPQPELRCGALVLDARAARVSVAGVPVKLTSHEFRVLSYLMHHSGQRGLQDRTHRTHLRAGFRSRFQHRRGLHRAPPPQSGRIFHRDRPRTRLPHAQLTMLRSFRARLVLASLLWTSGLLLLMHILMFMFIHVFGGAFRTHSFWPALAGLATMAAGLIVLQRGLTPFRSLRGKLLKVRTGADPRVEGDYPSEVQPLIDSLNALLEDREKAVKRAVATAGDLAHGLKTPLALLAQQADRAAQSGNPELAESIVQQVERMSRQVNYHLARARAAASGTAGHARCLVAPCADALVRTLLKLYAGRALDISSAIPPDLSARVQREDLDEMLGNLLDNACKWSNSRIRLEASRTGAALVLTVDDDGPGLAPDLRTIVLERGVRIDEAAPGSGLGLAIVRDLAELYGGSISFNESPLGGLRARITLPAA